ncbi:type II toxin-antitoxin system antitoxin YqcF [Bacillus spizizenii]|nr:type II toxin-antitoxin system antitoxin YqcF [Bacillus spizizenii]MCY8134563.1 type II toxin-antitoxin system antitoxin YqcF [Bacillus spizizenii]MCY8411920.1 type II toxin-antitoxin system antitoxin YqcF [Bacillus spizizenii]MCY8427139.1 type II toxin-antitoxin system antitoxin YqcF [Bacillus spizizenii]MCY8442911.1 type II toxin-antitoxin system antitoxin YqcF [Bacillus spizizenii]
MGVTQENKVIARTVLGAFGGKPKVTKYWDDNENSNIDILSVSDQPQEGITSYATLGLSDHSINYEVNGTPLRIEIVAAMESASDIYANVLSTCAFNIINSNFTCAPGVIFKNVISMYDQETDMRHVMFVSPFLWEEDLELLEFSNKSVTWLMAIPISEGELQVTEKHGPDYLQDLLESKQIDIYDIKRESVV